MGPPACWNCSEIRKSLKVPTRLCGKFLGAALLYVFYKPVAYGWLGEDETGLGRIVFELLSEVGDVDAEVGGLFNCFGSPDFGQELTMREHFAGVRHQEAEQGVLNGGQLYRFAGFANS